MELAQYYHDPNNKEGSTVTICDANITKFLSGKHHVLHVCFLKDLPRVPMMGLASYNYDDVWEIDIAQLKNYYLSFKLGKDRKDWTCCLRTRFDPSVKISFILESAKKNFVVLRDDLYLDYVLNGTPRSLRHCSSCYDDEKDRMVVTECGHYMCAKCWNKWMKAKQLLICWICSQTNSPCPVDHCRSGDTSRDYVLVPCGYVLLLFRKTGQRTHSFYPQ
ncbi:hypothetical protein OSTOST_08668 [Ostertagia ostertagi]